jgi:hypothetical protein
MLSSVWTEHKNFFLGFLALSSCFKVMLVLRISPLRVPSKIFQLPFFFCFGNLSKNLSLGLLKNIFGTSIILFSRHELSNSKICWGMCIYQYFFLCKCPLKCLHPTLKYGKIPLNIVKLSLKNFLFQICWKISKLRMW